MAQLAWFLCLLVKINKWKERRSKGLGFDLVQDVLISRKKTNKKIKKNVKAHNRILGYITFSKCKVCCCYPDLLNEHELTYAIVIQTNN